MTLIYTLGQLGWRGFYSQQLTLDELDSGEPARVCAVHRDRIEVLTEHGAANALPHADDVAVGDWIVLDRHSPRIVRLLERQSLIARIAAGSERERQLIAANVDTLFITSSCNQDFNLSRLERYLSVALQARVQPVIVLTKSDLTDAAQRYVDEINDALPHVEALTVNAMDPQTTMQLRPWLAPGQTVAFVGSSGVGKSTLINTLMKSETQATGAIREQDARGRHTTTSRQLLRMNEGAWLIDTPGMRELKIGAVDIGIERTFVDLEALATQCRFRDCSHEVESGCALRSALDEGRIDARRFRNYLKMRREAAHAARTVREQRERQRQFGRQAKIILKDKHRRKSAE